LQKRDTPIPIFEKIEAQEAQQQNNLEEIGQEDPEEELDTD
jgi:hypothetical protein